MSSVMKTSMLLLTALVAAAGLSAVLTAVASSVRAEEPAHAAPAVPASPQQTSASYGDWVMRCAHTGDEPSAKTVCEAAQTLVVKGQQVPLAQVAFGRESGGAHMLTVLLPVNISFDKGPTFAIEGDEAKGIKLSLKRCVPAGCLAAAPVGAGELNTFRNAQKPGKLTFTDAAERTLAMPISFRGLAQALDDLDRHS